MVLQNLHEVKTIESIKDVQKVGTNPKFLDKSVSVSFGEPWDFASSRLAGRAPAERRSREAMLPSGSKNSESSCWWTYGESDPNLVHAMDAFYH